MTAQTHYKEFCGYMNEKNMFRKSTFLILAMMVILSSLPVAAMDEPNVVSTVLSDGTVRTEYPNIDKVKEYNEVDNEIKIKEKTTEWLFFESEQEEMTIRLVNATPDLTTFTEIFEITAHKDIRFDVSKDFKTTWKKEYGEHDITGAVWYRWENTSYTAVLQNGFDTTYETIILPYNSNELKLFEDYRDGKTNMSVDDFTQIFKNIVYFNNGSISVNVETETPTFENTTLYNYEWIPFTPESAILSKDEVTLYKVIYTKPAELGEFAIQTTPHFRDVDCPEMTWYNAAWTKRKHITVTNPSATDGVQFFTGRGLKGSE